MSLLKLPYTNLHELNLDWIIEQLNKEGAVISVNDKHGIVTLTAEDINRTPNNPQTVEQALTSQGSSIQAVRTEIGVTPLPTAAQSITGAIAEHETDITTLNGNFTKTSVLISEQSGIAFCVAYKKAGWVTVIGHSAGQRQLDGSGSFQPFETLPEGYRPAEVQYGVGCTASGVGIALEISTNGLIQYLTPSNTTYWYYSFSFPVA